MSPRQEQIKRETDAAIAAVSARMCNQKMERLPSNQDPQVPLLCEKVEQPAPVKKTYEVRVAVPAMIYTTLFVEAESPEKAEESIFDQDENGSNGLDYAYWEIGYDEMELNEWKSSEEMLSSFEDFGPMDYWGFDVKQHDPKPYVPPAEGSEIHSPSEDDEYFAELAAENPD